MDLHGRPQPDAMHDFDWKCNEENMERWAVLVLRVPSVLLEEKRKSPGEMNKRMRESRQTFGPE